MCLLWCGFWSELLPFSWRNHCKRKSIWGRDALFGLLRQIESESEFFQIKFAILFKITQLPNLSERIDGDPRVEQNISGNNCRNIALLGFQRVKDLFVARECIAIDGPSFDRKRIRFNFSFFGGLNSLEQLGQIFVQNIVDLYQIFLVKTSKSEKFFPRRFSCIFWTLGKSPLETL